MGPARRGQSCRLGGRIDHCGCVLTTTRVIAGSSRSSSACVVTCSARSGTLPIAIGCSPVACADGLLSLSQCGRSVVQPAAQVPDVRHSVRQERCLDHLLLNDYPVVHQALCLRVAPEPARHTDSGHHVGPAISLMPRHETPSSTVFHACHSHHSDHLPTPWVYIIRPFRVLCSVSVLVFLGVGASGGTGGGGWEDQQQNVQYCLRLSRIAYYFSVTLGRDDVRQLDGAALA